MVLQLLGHPCYLQSAYLTPATSSPHPPRTSHISRGPTPTQVVLRLFSAFAARRNPWLRPVRCAAVDAGDHASECAAAAMALRPISS